MKNTQNTINNSIVNGFIQSELKNVEKFSLIDLHGGLWKLCQCLEFSPKIKSGEK